MYKNNLRRIRKEFQIYQQDPVPNCTVGELKGGDAGDPTHWDVTLIGPDDTPYSGGIFLIDVDFPLEYPFKPPSIVFKTPIYHMNFDESGINNLDILKDKWHPALTINKCLLSIIFLLAEPNPYAYINKECYEVYKADKNQYIINAIQFTKKYAI